MSLVVVVDGVEYPFEGINAAPIGTVRTLKKITKGLIDPEDDDGPKFQGVTARTFQEFAASVSEGVEAIDLMSDASMLLHVQALVYLSRWANGETPTFDECSVPMNALGLRNDDSDDEEADEEEAPKDVTGSDPVTTSEAA